jgi:2-polyprenyl-3-methyl-5-hydroxy-6-metoxy-1,4-benzoquinol methylase
MLNAAGPFSLWLLRGENMSESGPRFAFGKNWSEYLEGLNDDQIATAEEDLRLMLGGVSDLSDCSFLDAGCGSGLMSLSASRMGASRVHSFDFDADSVGATRSLNAKFASGTCNWTVEQGSLLDHAYMSSLGEFDVVYCWGVAHHTGQMWAAIENIAQNVAPDGQFVLAIYNDQGVLSDFWRVEKRIAAVLPRFVQRLIAAAYLFTFSVCAAVVDIARLENPLNRSRLARTRGMSPWHDAIDWVGGYPFEVASVDEVIGKLDTLGFDLQISRDVGRHAGCNEFLFKKRAIN